MRWGCLGRPSLKHLAPLGSISRETLKYFKVWDDCGEFTESLGTVEGALCAAVHRKLATGLQQFQVKNVRVDLNLAAVELVTVKSSKIVWRRSAQCTASQTQPHPSPCRACALPSTSRKHKDSSPQAGSRSAETWRKPEAGDLKRHLRGKLQVTTMLLLPPLNFMCFLSETYSSPHCAQNTSTPAAWSCQDKGKRRRLLRTRQGGPLPKGTVP